MRQPYPSDISREQFAEISPALESFRKKTKPKTVDLYDVFCAILYVSRSGCQWRMLPKDFPKHGNCFAYFQMWSEKKDDKTDSLLEELLKKIGWEGSTKRRPRGKN